MLENKLPNQPIDPDLQRRLKQLRSVPARDPQMVARSEVRFVAEVDELLLRNGFSPATRLAGISNYYQQWKEKWNMATPKLRTTMTLAAVFITLVVFMFGGAGMTAYASQTALPGDTLYGIKTGFEQTRLNLAFAERRLDEIARLIENGRYENIEMAVHEYEGYVQNAIAALETVAAGDPASLPELAAQVADSLKRYAATLSGMIGTLPENARSEVERAIQVSFSSGGFKDEIEITGIVEQITAESWLVAGYTLMLTPSAEIKGEFMV
jgi:predicted transcriptional regulator